MALGLDPGGSCGSQSLLRAVPSPLTLVPLHEVLTVSLPHLSLPLEARVVRKHLSDSRENPQLTTTTHGEVSRPLEHKLKRTGRVERVRGGWSLPN